MYGDPYTYSGGEEEALLAMFGAFAFLFFIVFAIAIVVYILMGIGLKKLADRENLANSWMAFVPIAQFYLIGQLVQERVNIQNLPVWLTAGYFGALVASAIPVVGFLALIAYMVLMFYALHKLFEMYSEKAVVMTVFNVLTSGSLYPIFIFAIRNNEKR